MDFNQEIQRDLKKINKIRDLCLQQNRDLTEAEAEILDELLDGIEALEELEEQRKIDRRFPANKSLTMQGFSNFDDDNYSRSTNNMKEDNGPFKSFGEQLGAVVNAGSPGGAVDARLHEVRAASGLSESVASEGGFLVQDSYGKQILDSAFETGLLGKLCMNIPMKTPSVKIPGLDESSRVDGSRWGGVLSYFKDEASSATKSKPTFRQIELNARKLICLVYLTEELMQDTDLLEQYVKKVCADEIGFKIDDGIINGLGTTGLLGILNSGSVVTIPKEVGQGSQTILIENIFKAYSRLIPSAKKDAVILCNSDTTPQLMQLSLQAGTGGTPAYLPASGVSGAPYGTLMGRRILEVEQCQTVGTEGDLIFAALNPGYLLGMRGGLRSQVSLHVQFLQDEQVLKVVARISGCTLLSQPITGYKSADTYSHFVTIADRD